MRALEPRHAERIRYGILAAREEFESGRLTPSQWAFLCGYHNSVALTNGYRGTRKPYTREIANIAGRRA